MSGKTKGDKAKGDKPARRKSIEESGLDAHRTPGTIERVTAKPRSGKAARPETGAKTAAGSAVLNAANLQGSALDHAVQSVLHPSLQHPPVALARAVDTTRPIVPPPAPPPVTLVSEARTEPDPAAAPKGPVLNRLEKLAQPERTSALPKPPPTEAKPAASGPVLPDFDAIGRNMRALMEQSSKVAAELYRPREERTSASFTTEMSDAVQTIGQVVEHWAVDPARLMQAQASLAVGFFDLWAKSAQRFGTSGTQKPDPGPPPPPADKRFKDPEWRENPMFDFVHKAFLLGTRWANDLVDKADGLDDDTKNKARFYMRQISSAFSPSNFVPTNPELLRETVRENGENLVRGMTMLAEDLAAGGGDLRIRHTDTSKFELGVNMALSPGKVVFRNDLFELLQYAPSTPQVFKRPLLIVPPWINKFYILDLNPEKSFIRWAVDQGLTVFVISWVNPDERHASKDFESYMREGVMAALAEIGTITGEADATAIGYCVGGTLLAVTLAHMAAHGDHRVSSATFFTAQVDFTHAGDLKVFADEAQISALEAQMKETGYLQGAKMAHAFNMLRPEDLIWSFAVDNYIKGKAPQPFDLLAWNSDSARMPAANHSFYLRNCYLHNNLARGLMEIAGERLDLKRITIPVYNLATREDHIAPAVSVFEGSRLFGGPVRYVLSGSGHVAGVVNPPAKAKYGFTDGPAPDGRFEDWLAAATEHPGSWWPDWLAWITAQAPAKVPARTPGGGRPVLGDAPGTYVRVKS